MLSKDYWLLTAYIGLVPIATKLASGMINHLDKRGILTVYWVLNNDDEVEFVVRNTGARGIMTDRPAAVGKLLQ